MRSRARCSFQPYELLKTIQRDTGGRQYKLLRESLARLQATTIRTNIRADKARRKERQFSWIESFTDVVDEQTQTSKGMSITLSDWFYEGVVMDGGVLSIDPLYFTISGGRERWLYRVARKHAGGAGEEGFAIGSAHSVREVRGRGRLPALQVRDGQNRARQRDPGLSFVPGGEGAGRARAAHGPPRTRTERRHDARSDEATR